jgi:heme oxygenase (biliverdin-producing, ferredoxin)
MQGATSDCGATSDTPSTASFSEVLREATKSLHVQAERSGVISDILHGRVSRYGYALLLRNLLPAYRSLEAGLEQYRGAPVLTVFANSNLYRAPALTHDLEALYGADWAKSLPLLKTGKEYGERISKTVQRDSMSLVGHAYARYLGDLSGGQILRRLLGRTLNLEPDELTFYDFPGIADLEAFKQTIRSSLDQVPIEHANTSGIVSEAIAAFEFNISLSEAIQSAIAT